jgi:ribosomal protein L37AE/L43A
MVIKVGLPFARHRHSSEHFTQEGVMECPKCKGLMMLERFSDFFLIFYAWKCINCGAIIDRTISQNRRKSLAAREQHTVAAR